jgi:N-hydroxyarylamine O-acetyltransferase
MDSSASFERPTAIATSRSVHRSSRDQHPRPTPRAQGYCRGPVPTLRELDAYLTRIGLEGPADLTTVHRAHATSIAFENFDPFSGTPVSLELGHLEDKLVHRQRGGYCFEQNLLLQAALESMGSGQISTYLARVRMGPAGTPRPLDHLLLRVVDESGDWLADVGFGGGGLLDPLPFEVGRECDQSGWRYRLVEDGSELVLQTFQDGGWVDMYGFVAEPVQPIDIEVSNWYTATLPTSSFVTGLFAGFRRVDRCLSLFVYEEAVLVERPVGEASNISTVPLSDVPTLLSDRFDIAGARIGRGGKVELAPRT